MITEFTTIYGDTTIIIKHYILKHHILKLPKTPTERGVPLFGTWEATRAPERTG